MKSRLTVGAALIALALAGVSADAAVPEDPGVSPTQAGTPDAAVEYHGLVDGAAATATAAESGTKSAAAGGVGTADSNAAVDVPGEARTGAEADGAAAARDLTVAATPDASALQQALDDAESDRLRVIVTMADKITPMGQMDKAQAAAQSEAFAASLDELAGSLKVTESAQVHRYHAIPAAVWNVDQAGLDRLLANSDVAAVTVDKAIVRTHLDSSTQVVDSDLLQAAGVDGAGHEGGPVSRYVVGVVDSGVDNDHNAFAGRIVAEACFSAAFDCPGGVSQAFGLNAGESCTHSVDCDHGTHVGGIAAGAFHTGGHEGVADGAGIVAINASSDSATSNRATFFFSDLDRAMDHLIDLKGTSQPDLVAANFSIGTPTTYADGPACDNLVPATRAMFGQLRSAGIAPVVAAGNSGDKTQMSFPGCLSNVISIGATNDADVPAGFSNASPGLDLWAPGVSITAPVPTGNNTGTKDGTSMAAPHVTGAFALVAECIGFDSVNSRETLLQNNGVGVNVLGNVRTRINVLDAATSTVNNNDFGSPETIPPAANIDDWDYNVCADSEAGEPGPGSIENSIWWQWTPSTTGTATISTNDAVFSTTFDTVLSVFTGNSLGSLQLIAHDDDGGDGLRSLVTMPVNAGTTYRIRVDGFGGANGELNLQVDLGPAPTCHGLPATIVGTPGDDDIVGTNGDDVIMALAGDDRVRAMDGNDEVCLGEGDDEGHGMDGNDRLWGGPGSDAEFGGNGNDWVVGNAGFGDTDDLGDRLFGGSGNDLVDGWVGNDRLTPGSGDDDVYGAEGSDWVLFIQGPVTADLGAGTAFGEGSDSLFGLEHISGTSASDVLRGNAARNIIVGRGGNDSIRGFAGNDRLVGGSGHDLVVGNNGNDTAWGGSGNDDISGGSGNDVLRGSGGADDINGNAGNDRLFGNAGPDTLRGGANNDLCNGGSQFDTAFGCEVTVGIP